MRTADLNAVFARADETIRALDTLPQAQEFFRDILEFVRDVVPVMAELQASIEQTSEKLPTASRQLDKVTAANELASTEILDIVERIILRIETVQRSFTQSSTHVVARAREIDIAVKRVLEKFSADPDVKALGQVWGEMNQSIAAATDVDAQETMLQSIKMDCTSIMIALQVQDITAQQIAAVNKMMQSVDQGLNALLQHVRGEECGGTGEGFSHHHVNIVFDPAATYDTTTERQVAVDEVVEIAKSTEGNKKN